MIYHGEKLNPQSEERLQEALGWLDSFISKYKFAAGDNITIADHTLLANVSTIMQTDIEFSNYTNILAWMERCKTDMPGYDMNEKGAEEWGKMFKSRCNQS